MTGHVPPAPGAAATPKSSAIRGTVLAWGLWDWAFAAFNAVATTFVFNTYLSGPDPAVARAGRHRRLTTGKERVTSRKPE